MKLLHNARDAASTPPPSPGSDMTTVSAILRLRMEGADEVKAISAALFPEDDDG